MKKYTSIWTLFIILIYSGFSFAQTTLVKRDIAVIKMQTDITDSFTFITFVDLDPGTVIYFTSVGANVAGIFEFGNTNINDGTFAYTVPAGGHDAGDIFTWVLDAGTPNFSVYIDSISTRTTERNLNSTGDSLTVFQKVSSPGGGGEALSSPSFISVVSTASTQFGGNPSDTNETNLPAGLSTTAPVSALALGAGSGVDEEFDNIVYSGGYTFATVAAAKDSFFNINNYFRGDNQTDPTYLNLVNNIPASAMIAVPANNPPTAASFSASATEDSTFTFSITNFSYADSDGDPLNNLLIEGIPSAGTLYVDANNNDLFDAGEQLSNGSSVSRTNLIAGNLQYIQNGNTDTSFQFEVNDGIENSTGNYIATLNVSPIPAVINAVTVPAADTYITGESLNFNVTFSKNVTVNLNNGTPGLSLTIGSTKVIADYASGSGNSTLVFSYVIQSGQTDSNGISINSLQSNGGSIQGTGGLDANLTLNAVGDSSLVLVDAVAPLLNSVTRLSPSTSPTDADQVTLRYTFTEAVNGVQSGNFFSNNPAVISTIISTPVSPTVYDVQFAGSNLAEYNGSIIFGIISAGIVDIAGNSMSSTNVIGTNDNSYEFVNVYFIGGVVSGLLDGNYMVLTNDQGDQETIMMNGAYLFESPYVFNQTYTTEIDLEPINPIQPCQVSNATGVISSNDVIDINVTCDVGVDLIFRNAFE